MQNNALPIHSGLAGSSRLRSLAGGRDGLAAADLLLLAGAGTMAAVATALLDFSLRIPGHAIMRAVFPMALGLAVAPRRMGGMVMGASALGSAMGINLGGYAAIGMGAMTSLVLIGPFLDLALRRARQGWQLYLGFAVAGLLANLAALTLRGGGKLVGLDHAAARPFATWWLPAAGSYAVCGLLAGTISAAVWFRFSGGGRRHADAGSLP